MFEQSDSQLISKALKGNKRAWLKLVKRYEKPLYNYALRMVSHPDDALDLLQEIFLSVFRNLSSYRGDGQFKSWIFRIAHFRCVEYYRKKRPNDSLDDVPEQVDEHQDSQPEMLISRLQNGTKVVDAMQRLPINQRAVVELKFFQQFTFEDIARQLGISVNTAKSRLYSALDKLKLDLEVENV